MPSEGQDPAGDEKDDTAIPAEVTAAAQLAENEPVLLDTAPAATVTPEEIEIILKAPAPDDALDEDMTAPKPPTLQKSQKQPTLKPYVSPIEKQKPKIDARIEKWNHKQEKPPF